MRPSRSAGEETRLRDPSRTSGRRRLTCCSATPGSGKSTSFEAERDALGRNACLLTARDFLALDPSVHPEWREKVLFIDGLDEVRAGSGDARRPLDAIRRCLDTLGRPRFRLSCREADWLGTNDRTSLVGVSPHAGLIVLRLEPLARKDVERILSDRAGVDDAASFIGAATEKGVGGFLENPPVPEHAGRRGDERGRLAGKPSGALRAGVRADGPRAQRGARGRRTGGGRRGYAGGRSTGCSRASVRGAPRFGLRGLRNCGGS